MTGSVPPKNPGTSLLAQKLKCEWTMATAYYRHIISYAIIASFVAISRMLLAIYLIHMSECAN
jgi:hypothetical protein